MAKTYYYCYPMRNHPGDFKDSRFYLQTNFNIALDMEAETIVTDYYENDIDDIPDTEWDAKMNEVKNKILSELKIRGIYKDEWGCPIFLYM